MLWGARCGKTARRVLTGGRGGDSPSLPDPFGKVMVPNWVRQIMVPKSPPKIQVSRRRPEAKLARADSFEAAETPARRDGVGQFREVVAEWLRADADVLCHLFEWPRGCQVAVNCAPQQAPDAFQVRVDVRLPWNSPHSIGPTRRATASLASRLPRTVTSGKPSWISSPLTSRRVACKHWTCIRACGPATRPTLGRRWLASASLHSPLRGYNAWWGSAL